MPDLLPPNSTAQERAISLALDRLPDVPLKTLWTPATCPEAQLPWLAWALSVDEWNAAWPVETKRQVIAASIEQHRKKGTVGALRRALQRLGYEVEIDEATGVAYTFRLRVRIRAGDSAGGAVSEDALNRAVVVALRQKNARSALTDTLFVADTDATGLFIGGVTLSGLQYEAKVTQEYTMPPSDLVIEQTGASQVSLSWTGSAEYYEVEWKLASDGTAIGDATAYVNSINNLSLLPGEYIFQVRSFAGGYFSSWLSSASFTVSILPPFNLTASNNDQPSFLAISFNCFGNTFVLELCAANNEWTTDVQSTGGTPIGGLGQAVYAGIMSGFYDLRVKAVYSFGDSEWVEVRNIEVLPNP